LQITYTKTKPTHRLIGFLIQLTFNVSGTAGTHYGISQLVRDVQVVNNLNVNQVNMKGQTLSTMGLDSFKDTIDLGLGYQTWVDALSAATGTNAVGQYIIFNEMKGNSFTITVNVGPASASGFTVITTASYTLTVSGLELPNPENKTVHYTKILGEYITGTATYNGSVPTRYVVVAVDNQEMSTLTAKVTVGGKTYSDTDILSGEDVFNSHLPPGLLPSGYGTATAGMATLGAKDPQTLDQIYAIACGGPAPSLATVSFNIVPTLGFSVLTKSDQ